MASLKQEERVLIVLVPRGFVWWSFRAYLWFINERVRGQAYFVGIIIVVDRLTKACPLCIESPGAVYHITSRGNERKADFRDDQNR